MSDKRSVWWKLFITEIAAPYITILFQNVSLLLSFSTSDLKVSSLMRRCCVVTCSLCSNLHENTMTLYKNTKTLHESMMPLHVKSDIAQTEKCEVVNSLESVAAVEGGDPL